MIPKRLQMNADSVPYVDCTESKAKNGIPATGSRPIRGGDDAYPRTSAISVFFFT